MRNRVLLFALLCASVLSAFAAPSLTKHAARPSALTPFADQGLNFQIVRVEYVDILGNGYHIDTDCHLVNTSVTSPIVLKQIFIFGPGGITGPATVYTGMVDQKVQPLGEVDLRIDNKIPGVLPQTSARGNGVRNVVVAWEGPADALGLSANIQRWLPYSDYARAHAIETGRPLQF